jgi:hygromycin-B 7''-O-kinase
MLPPVSDLAAWRALRRDLPAQRPALEAIATRHVLPANELRFIDKGTHLVWETGRSVIKLFVPLWPEDSDSEIVMLEMVSGSALPAPRLEAVGEFEGWRYVVMSKVEGEALGVAWRALDAAGRMRLAAHLGETMAVLATLPRERLADRAITQEALLAERRDRVLSDQRERGGDDALEAELRRFLEELPPLAHREEVVLHADLTDDNVLVSGDRVTGVIDFADAFVGPAAYEFAAPACFVTRGSPAQRDALIRGRGFVPTPELIATIRAWAILHRYGHVARMMQAAGVTTLRAFLESI